MLDKENEKLIKNYLNHLKNNKESDSFNFGYIQESKRWNESSMVKEPNAIFAGAMGSGKSVALNFSINDYLLKNMDKSLIFIVDLIKSAQDYDHLFKQENVVNISSEKIFIESLNFLYDEAVFRTSAFQAEKSANIDEYEKTTNKKLARIVFVIEEFHAVCEPVLKFSQEYNSSGSSANKFHYLMRAGRSLGIWFMTATQWVTVTNVPSNLIHNFTNKQVFKISRTESQYLLCHEKAGLDIKSHEKGKAFTDNGMVQFPYIKKEQWNLLLAQYHKPFKAIIFTQSLKEIKEKIKKVEQSFSIEEKLEQTLDATINRLKFKMSLLIRQYRNEHNLSNKELAKYLNMDESNLSKIIVNEKENITKVSLDSLIKILAKLSLNDSEIVFYLNKLADLN